MCKCNLATFRTSVHEYSEHKHKPYNYKTLHNGTIMIKTNVAFENGKLVKHFQWTKSVCVCELCPHTRAHTFKTLCYLPQIYTANTIKRIVCMGYAILSLRSHPFSFSGLNKAAKNHRIWYSLTQFFLGRYLWLYRSQFMRIKARCKRFVLAYTKRVIK